MKKPQNFGRFVLVLGLFMIAACNAELAPDDKSTQPAGRETFFTIAVGEAKIEAQLAVKEPEMRRGLMYRKSLGENRGMLFVYENAQQLSFWMRNTFISLDIGFFDSEGILRETRRMYPHDETSIRSKDATIQYALEANTGWFKENGLKPGVKINLVAVRAALKARGFDPGRFQMPPLPLRPGP